MLNMPAQSTGPSRQSYYCIPALSTEQAKSRIAASTVETRLSSTVHHWAGAGENL